MGAIARNIANNITTSGVFTSSAITNSSVTGITVLANASDGITLISSQTANDSASISFTSGITSTYKAYKFVFSNIHPRTNQAYFSFNMSTDSGSNYNVTKTTTFFSAYHYESGSSTGLLYQTGSDLAQSTGYQHLSINTSSASDDSISGSLTLFNPSSTVYVKHFISSSSDCYTDVTPTLPAQLQDYVAGYGNTTSAVNAIRFQMSLGNFDGTIYLYGIK
jgi:hypothetical protein